MTDSIHFSIDVEYFKDGTLRMSFIGININANDHVRSTMTKILKKAVETFEAPAQEQIEDGVLTLRSLKHVIPTEAGPN